ncbi:unnamed protein product [Clonostachys solani]|uniref:Uncharacterized protein n=1 Tax=Clonostachys solani TaxID=160281 RepID=A0A9N9ZHB0_9HYPO|nr:unnamed protein product [Clonostachys solani]
MVANYKYTLCVATRRDNVNHFIAYRTIVKYLRMVKLREHLYENFAVAVQIQYILPPRFKILGHAGNINNDVLSRKYDGHPSISNPASIWSSPLDQVILPNDAVPPEQVPPETMSDTWICARKVPQLPLICATGEAASEVVSHGGQVKHDGYGVDHCYSTDPGSHARRVEYVGSLDRPVGMGCDGKRVPVVVVEYEIDLAQKLYPVQRGRGQAE